jgi:hypothetical protein
MPDQADPTPAPPLFGAPALSPSDPDSARRSRDDGFADGEVLECTPEQKEIVEEFNWADEQQAKGLFAPYEGKYIAIVHKTVHAAGADISAMRAETAAKTGVKPYRVAIYLVESAINIY